MDDMATLWQHEDTGIFSSWTAGDHIFSHRWFKVPTMYEDELPESISNEDYKLWYDASVVIDGVRMGPKI